MARVLQELDLSWTAPEEVLDAALMQVAEQSFQLRVLNLCGSSVTIKSVQRLLKGCPQLAQINLSSCRALPRGVKRLYTDAEKFSVESCVHEEG